MRSKIALWLLDHSLRVLAGLLVSAEHLYEEKEEAEEAYACIVRQCV